MSRVLGLSLLAAVLALAPAALADGPQGATVQGGSGVVDPAGTTRYVAFAAGNGTLLEKIETAGGAPTGWTTLRGAWGIPTVTPVEFAGVSQDGKKLFLGGTRYSSPSRFLVVDTHTLRPVKRIVLKGSFAFDALSPDGSRLYLIQHTRANDFTHYVVRAYDLDRGRLLPGLIADNTQKDWVMEGSAVTRATSTDGRWVYTLYANPGGYPFVHALDTVRGVAHCIGLPFTGDQQALWNVVLTPRDAGRTLGVHWKSGRPWLAVNTTNWRITHEDEVAAATPAGGGVPWRWPVAGAAIALALALTAATRRRWVPARPGV